MLASPIRVLVTVPVALLLIQLPAKVLWKAGEDGSSSQSKFLCQGQGNQRLSHPLAASQGMR